MNVFDYVNAINYDKQDLFADPQAEKDYVPFIVNKSLSYFPDTILFANQMNINNLAPKQWQFEFLRNAVSKRRRYSKWTKKDAASDNLTLVAEYYQYSLQKAAEIVDLLSAEQLDHIKETLNKGGRQ